MEDLLRDLFSKQGEIYTLIASKRGETVALRENLKATMARVLVTGYRESDYQYREVAKGREEGGTCTSVSAPQPSPGGDLRTQRLAAAVAKRVLPYREPQYREPHLPRAPEAALHHLASLARRRAIARPTTPRELGNTAQEARRAV